MSGAKGIRLVPATRAESEQCYRHWHYSGRGYAKSILHMGIVIDGSICGCMSWGPGVDTRKSIAQIPGTAWDGYLELNRMALSPLAPRCSESRALAIAVRQIRMHAPWVEWLVSYADGAQAGPGTIYRAAGWTLTQCRQNATMWRDIETGARVSAVGLRTSARLRRRYGEAPSRSPLLARLDGYMRRYHYGLSRRAIDAIAALACADTEEVSAWAPPTRAFDSTCPLSIPTQTGSRPDLGAAIRSIPRYADPCGATSRVAARRARASRAIEMPIMEGR